ncbi:unnamed protein product [Closterium sp. NIES-53]
MLALCREHKQEHRTKHIALRYFLARELLQRDQLRLAYVASEANTAHIFTKALPPGDHQRFCTMLACFALLDWSCDLLFGILAVVAKKTISDDVIVDIHFSCQLAPPLRHGESVLTAVKLVADATGEEGMLDEVGGHCLPGL